MGKDCVLGGENLCPDLVVKKGNDIIIFDITVPFDNGLDAFDEARRLKVEKYKNLADELCTGGKRAIVEANLVRVLGSWYPANGKTLGRL